jgi:serine/threonine protein kinase
MPKDCAFLHLRLLFEYSRLVDWADLSGLSDKTQHAHYDITYATNRAQIYAALNEIAMIVEALRKIENSYSKEIEASEREARAQADGSTQNEQQFIAIDVREREPFTKADQKALDELKRTLVSPRHTGRRKHVKAVEIVLRGSRALKQVLRHPRGLKWSALDMGRFESQLSRLSKLTKFLHQSVGVAIQRQLLSNSQDAYMVTLDIADDTTMIKTVLQSLTATPHLSTLMEALAIFKLRFREISVTKQFDRKAIELDTSTVSISCNEDAEKEHLSLRSFATIDQTNVWIEWKRYHEIDAPAQQTTIRVQQLTSLLKAPQKPAELCIPHCRGYIVDQEHSRFGFVYDFAAPSETTPPSLFDLLNTQPCLIPSRIKTAQSLANSLLYFHAAGWLHKDLRSANVIMADHSEGQGTLPRIYISGFEYARPDEEGTSTMQPDETNVYCHPDYQLKPYGYKRSYDFYSLGIVLLELAYWQTARTIPGLIPDASTEQQLMRSPQYHHSDGYRPTTRDCVLHDTRILEGVRQRIGERYAQAVEACIKGVGVLGINSSLDETEKSVGDLLQIAFMRLVIDNLSSIVL